jgi:hypothetical protein
MMEVFDITHKSSSNNEMLALRHASVFSLDMPLSFSNIILRTNHNSLERAILLDVEDLIDMVKVGSKLFVIRVVGRPCPVLVHLWPRELILRHLRVNSGSRIAVPAPCAAEIRASFVKYGSKPMLAEALETEDTTWEQMSVFWGN